MSDTAKWIIAFGLILTLTGWQAFRWSRRRLDKYEAEHRAEYGGEDTGAIDRPPLPPPAQPTRVLTAGPMPPGRRPDADLFAQHEAAVARQRWRWEHWLAGERQQWVDLKLGFEHAMTWDQLTKKDGADGAA